MKPSAKWIVSGGTVVSRYDGQRQYISAGQVARLHRLGPNDWRPYIYEREGGEEPHLWPRSDGEYRDLRGHLPPGMVRRSDRLNSPCWGKVKVALRDEESGK